MSFHAIEALVHMLRGMHSHVFMLFSFQHILDRAIAVLMMAKRARVDVDEPLDLPPAPISEEPTSVPQADKVDEPGQPSLASQIDELGGLLTTCTVVSAKSPWQRMFWAPIQKF